MGNHGGAIDIVLPYVDSSVLEWQETFLAAKHKKFVTERARHLYLGLFSNRYASYGLFRYWWRGYEQYAPPGKVHLLVQSKSQIPEWLDTSNSRIVVHYHEEFMPKEILPSFNSSCIELCFLKNCGTALSPFFLMMNDDFYFNAPCTIENFVKNGRPLTWKAVRRENYVPINLFRTIVCNNIALAGELAHKHCPPYEHNHLAICLDRDKALPILDSVWNTILPNMTQFRDGKNHSHWFLRYWQDLSDVSVHDTDFPHHGYLEMDKASPERIAGISHAKVICLNDVAGKVPKCVAQYLESHFNKRSTFELG